jgi:uncharacterized membrane protein
MTLLPNATTRSGIVTCISELALLIPGSLGLLLAGFPTVLCPFPALTIIPAFLLADWNYRAALLVPVLLFFVWNPGLFRGAAAIPRRSFGLLAVATLLSAADFAIEWKLGLAYQGSHYTYLAIEFVLVASVWALFIRNRRSAPSFKANLVLHWILFAWLSWYALPYLGELP